MNVECRVKRCDTPLPGSQPSQIAPTREPH
jgi:hypothetical protein